MTAVSLSVYDHRNNSSDAQSDVLRVVRNRSCFLRCVWAWYLFIYLFFLTHIYFPASGQAVFTGVVSSPPRFLPPVFIAHRVQQSHCSSIFHRVFANSRSRRAFRKSICAQEKVPTNLVYTSMHSGEFELTKLTYTRLEDNLIRHQGDWLLYTRLLSHRACVYDILGWETTLHTSAIFAIHRNSLSCWFHGTSVCACMRVCVTKNTAGVRAILQPRQGAARLSYSG